MLKGCYKLFFFGVIFLGVLYYIYSQYDIRIYPSIKENAKSELLDKMLSSFEINNLKVEDSNIDLNSLLDSVKENIDNIDFSALKKIYSDFSDYIADNVLDSNELEKLKKTIEKYEKR